jgi:hypothetical protein
MRIRPVFVSLEEFDTETINFLFDLGYNMFSVRPQHDKSWVRLPFPPREGKFVEQGFTCRDSGPFGCEAPEWMSVRSARQTYHRLLRRLGKHGIGPPRRMVRSSCDALAARDRRSLARST